MGLDNLGVGLAVMFMTGSTIGLGGICVLIAWKDVIYDRRKNARWRVPAALHTFSAAVYLDLIGYILLSLTAPSLRERYIGNIRLAAIVYLGVLIGSFVLVLSSLVLLRREGRPGRGAVLAGSRIVFVIDVLGFLVIITGLR
jgi:tellurite resistance protein TehA-like permease